MKLRQLFMNIEYELYGDKNIEINNLSYNSKDINTNGLFFCLKGRSYSGFDFINEAIKNGAVAFVVDKEVFSRYKSFIESLQKTVVVVEDVRFIVAKVCHNFFDGNKFSFKLIGVTGTNGKTTIANVITNGLINAGFSVCMIGTSGVFVNGDMLKGEELTTPDPIDLYNIFEFINKIGVDYCVMEVSAHALDLNKVNSLTFEYGIFTNLTEDHLDYFKNMQNYCEAKRKFFDLVKTAVINIDDEYGKVYWEEINTNKISYGKTSGENKIIYNNKYFKIVNNNLIIKIKSNLLGEYNAYNLMASYIVLKEIIKNNVLVKHSLENVPKINGRYNEFKTKTNAKVVLDFAHTPDGLEKVLTYAKSTLKSGGKLYSLFGCGGNRDKDKRPIMGAVSGKIADFTFVAIDNPRYENPMSVMSDIEQGLISVGAKYQIFNDRVDAIREVINRMTFRDIVVISGKGMEPYYEVNGQKKPYREDIVIKSLIKK